ncbi:sialidase family protein [Streptomyces sp. CRN 30]|uniref:sialidase family protein n=1 Tax=Streptomyces sp. CRN 30 TaxID=3075613 RepID=UPI002A81F86E|nr:sialidase family protein [Streptomyces sp. CRN 30]
MTAAGPGVREPSVPFRAGEDGYTSFRIPAVVRTTENTLLAFCEGREDGPADHGTIRVVCRRSQDGGRTWGPLHVAAENGDGLAGNPAPVVLADGRVLLVHVRNAAYATEAAIRRGEVPAEDGRRVWVTHSDDDGRTWTAPTEITAGVKRPDWLWYATGPGHALRLTTGRVVVPANHSVPDGPGGPDGGPDGGHCLISDDGGTTWSLGYADDGGANESTAAQLPDGTLYVNARTMSPSATVRADARSTDGGTTLTAPFAPCPDLTGPVCQGSLLQLRDPDVLLFSGPADPAARARMTVRASTDGGTSWSPVRTLDDRPAAYSDLVRVDDRTVGLLYETGDDGPYDTITFERLTVWRT